MKVEFLIEIFLAAAATFFVVVTSIGLVIHKATNIQKLRRRQRLHTEYSELLANALLRSLPSLPHGPRMSTISEQYESLIEPIKHKLENLSPRRKKIHREALRLSLIDFARDLSGETSDRLVYFFSSFGFVDDEINLLKSKHWWVRAQAAHDIGLLHAKRGIAALTEALEDSHPDVRNQAIESLAVLVGVNALGTILRLSKNISSWVASELSVIVMRFKETAVPFLIKALDSSDKSVVIFSIEMLAEIGFVSAVEPLMEIALNHPNTIARTKAVEALGRLGDERAESILCKLAQHPLSHLLRIRAIEALGRIGSPSAIPLLLRRIRAGTLEEKIATARAVATAGPDGLGVLRSLKSDSESLVRDIVLQVLEEFNAEIVSS